MNGNDSDVEDLGSDEDIDEDSDYDGNNSDDDDSSSADKSENDDENDDDGGNKKEKTKEEEENKFRWRKRDVTTTPDKVFQPEVDNIEETKTPIEYFRQFWTDIIDLVVQQTNLYSTQKTSSPINTTKEETEQLMGIHLRRGIVQLPSYKMYWSQKMRIPAIADRMPLTRYEKQCRQQYNGGNASKLAKIQPVIDIFREQCLKVNPEECHCVDEQIIPAKATPKNL